MESERVSCMFEIEEKHMEFCLPTLCHIFGLGQHAHAAARIILTDKKAIGLCLLKKACLLDLKQPVHKTLYRTYWSWFKHQVVPVSFNNNSSVKLVENILGGLIVHLNEQSMDAVDFMHDKYHPYFEDLTNVSNGGDNIWYGPPAKSLPEWNSFDKNPKLHPFINQVGEAIKDFWGNKTNFMQYETVFLFSELNETRDNIPQKAHVDLSEDLIEFEESKIGAKSLIGFTPINPDGMMLLVWTDGRPKKHRTREEIKQDHARRAKDIPVTPGQYFLYIPRGVFVALPGDTIHAGGFCFGRKWQCPTKNNRKTNNVHYFQNQHLHFTFCCSSLAVEEASGETNITIVDDDRKPCVNDFVANKEIMDNLFKCLLDHHPKFEEEHKEVVTQSNKRQKKYLKEMEYCDASFNILCCFVLHI